MWVRVPPPAPRFIWVCDVVLTFVDRLWTNLRMKAKPSSASTKPFLIKRGNVSVKIYTGTNTFNGGDYPQYTLAYYDGNSRRKKTFSNLDEAKREAELTVTKLANGEGAVLRLISIDRANYLQALETLRPLGKDLRFAIAEYAEAIKLLPHGTTLRDAVTDFARRRNTITESITESITVPKLVAEYLEAKTKAGRSQAHLRDLRLRLTRFGEAFQLPVAQITGKLVQAWMDGLKVANRTKLNELRHVTSLLTFAVRRKYAPRDFLTELEAVERPEVTHSQTLIFSPAELSEMFDASREMLIPWLVFGGLCGLRSAEILRLDWRDVNLERRFLTVQAFNSKTAQRRLVPLSDSAMAWLKPLAKDEGRVVSHLRENWFYAEIKASVNRARRSAGIEAKFDWKRNGLRHSFCSYRLAITQDAAKTSLEAGNSPQMIFRHYRELTTEDEAKEWFGVMPPQPIKNVIPLQMVAN